ncbi:MAG TPA: 3-phosphoshikimate 1-carboxyvinyltransferase, partial [bacterium]
MLPDRLTLAPIRTLAGTVHLPGSKSLSNRILLLSALAEGETEITNVLDSEDVQVMLTALRRLGVAVRGTPGAGSLWVRGVGGAMSPPDAGDMRLHLGNAGTAMRPLTAVLAAGRGTFVLEGVPRMHERPIGDLVEGLRQLGAKVDYVGNEGFPPLRITANGLRGGVAGI